MQRHTLQISVGPHGADHATGWPLDSYRAGPVNIPIENPMEHRANTIEHPIENSAKNKNRKLPIENPIEHNEFFLVWPLAAGFGYVSLENPTNAHQNQTDSRWFRD